MSIYVWTGRINYPAMRWPCPYGYHVPMGTELQSMKDIMTALGIDTSNGICCKTYLKIPFSWHLYYNTGNRNNEGRGYLWGSTKDDPSPSRILISDTTFLVNTGANWATSSAKPIRPFKDDPVKPTSSWTTLYDGSSVATGAGIFQNASSGLISLSSDGVNWITIADKNLWATTVYNDWDTFSEANCGKFFQRWNNYPFPFSGASTKSSTLVDASWYWPWNWYYNSTYRTPPNSSPYYWDTSNNLNIRGWVVWAVKADVKDICVGKWLDDYSSKQWPCPSGFHMGSWTGWERVAINSRWQTLWAWTSTWGTNFSKYLKMPMAWYRSWTSSTWSKTSSWSVGRYWNWDITSGPIYIWFGSSSLAVSYLSSSANPWYSIRPFKDIPVAPDNTWTTLYDGSSVATWAWIFWSKWLWLISISKDWVNWNTIADKNIGAKVVWNYWDTVSEDNCGWYFQRWNNYMFPYSWNLSWSTAQVDVSWFWPWNYYSDSQRRYNSSSSTSRYSQQNNRLRIATAYKWNVKQVYVGTTLARPTYNPWIYWNKSMGLISISSDWKNWITIADKNLGAKTTDTSSADSYGWYYQFWNNYWFPASWFSTSTSQVNLSSYWPTNPYYSTTFIKNSSWIDSSNNTSIWWWDSADMVSRQWPCPAGFHISKQWWSSSDRVQVLKDLKTLSWQSTITWDNLSSWILYPKAWHISFSSWSRSGSWSDGWGMTSYRGTRPSYLYWSSSVGVNNVWRWYACPIRPFKNEPVVPDNSRAVLYQPS